MKSKNSTKSLFILALLLALFNFISPLQADEDWVEAYRKELSASGYSKDEIEMIVKQEKIRRAKILKAKAGAAKNKPIKQETSTKKLTKKEKEIRALQEIEAEWNEILLEEYELSGSNLKTILKYEMDVQKKLVKLTQAKKLEREDVIRRVISIKRIKSKKVTSSSKHGKARYKRYLDKLCDDYDDWYYAEPKKTKSTLKKIVEGMIGDEIKKRVKRARPIRNEILNEIKILTTGIGGKGQAQIVNVCRLIWDKLIVVLTEKEYKKLKSTYGKTLKSNGCSKKTTKIFFKKLDSFIDDDYEEEQGELSDEEKMEMIVDDIVDKINSEDE